MTPSFRPPMGNPNTNSNAHMSMEGSRPRYDYECDYPPSTTGSMVSEDDGRPFHHLRNHSISVASVSDDGGPSQYLGGSPENNACPHSQPSTHFEAPNDGSRPSYQPPTHHMSRLSGNSANLHAHSPYQFQSPLLSPAATGTPTRENKGNSRHPSISPHAPGRQGRVTEYYEGGGNSGGNPNPDVYSGRSTRASPFTPIDFAEPYSAELRQLVDARQAKGLGQDELALLPPGIGNPYQDNLTNDFLEQFKHNSDTAGNLDVICAILKLSPEVWHHLCMLRTSQEAQLKLRPHLRPLFEVPPAGLWELLVTIKSIYFEVLPSDFVERLRSLPLPIPKGPSRTRSVSVQLERGLRLSGGNVQAELHPSPGPNSSPRQEEKCPTPMPRPRSRDTSRRRDMSRHAKGRAPHGYKYFCPYHNCRCRKGFTNWGNFSNHVVLLHAHNLSKPETYLQLDSTSPQDNGDEWALHATTETNDQPLHQRDFSQDIRGTGGVMVPAGQDKFNEDSVHNAANSTGSPQECRQVSNSVFDPRSDLPPGFSYQDGYPQVPMCQQLDPVQASFLSPNTMTEEPGTNGGGMFYSMPASIAPTYRGNQ